MAYQACHDSRTPLACGYLQGGESVVQCIGLSPMLQQLLGGLVNEEPAICVAAFVVLQEQPQGSLAFPHGGVRAGSISEQCVYALVVN